MNKNQWIMGVDPYKKVKWYHRILKFFGRKIKIGSIGVMKWTDESKTTVEFVSQKDLYL